jgi:hypothetical protein
MHLPLLEYYEDHRMVQRIDMLYKEYMTMSQADVRTALTAWDNDNGRAMAMGEKRLEMPPKKSKWSPVLRNLAKTRLIRRCFF